MAEYKSSPYNKPKKKTSPKDEKTRVFNGELKPLMNEAQHPQSDSDFLSKASIALKESRESETWLHMLSDNGYLDQRMSESILHDCARINKILITITAKVKKRLNS